MEFPSVTQSVSGRVAVAVKTLRLTFRAREGSVVGSIHLRHSKREWEVVVAVKTTVLWVTIGLVSI